MSHSFPIGKEAQNPLVLKRFFQLILPIYMDFIFTKPPLPPYIQFSPTLLKLLMPEKSIDDKFEKP